MAEQEQPADLDDFFAKRDKKRPKGKKFATADDASKVLETKAKERKKAETLKYVPPPNESGEAPPALTEYKQQQENEDDEWREVEEVKPDYTGLKIQELILDDDDEETGNKDSDKEDADQESKNGPWNKKVKDKEEPKPVVEEAAVEILAPVVPESEKEKEVVAEGDERDEPTSEDNVAVEEPKKTGGYVPPNRRKDATATPAMPPSEDGGRSSQGPTSSGAPAGAYVPPSRRGGQPSSSVPSSGSGAKAKKGDFNFENETSFPSLGS